MNFEIREIKEADFNDMVVLFHEFAVFEKLPEKMTNSVEQVTSEKEFIKGFVAVAEGNIIGYVTFFFAYYTWVGKSMYMDDLYVKPDYRGQGVGTTLINKVMAHAKEAHCKRLRWQVSGWNREAIEFYKKLGAAIDDIERNCDLIF